ncbi:MAG: polyketide synthase dehydratase domain-containing protein, partial [Microcoleaceae cyanobacterium]
MQTFLEQQNRIATEVFGDRSEEKVTPWPLLGQVVECTDQYLYSERVFNLAYDLFLQDHTLGDRLSVHNSELFPLAIIPFTISLEIIAEAAVYLTGSELTVTAIEDVQGYQWITLDRGEVRLGIEAKLQSDRSSVSTQVDVKLFQLENNPESEPKLVFEGRVILAANYPPSQPSLVGALSELNSSRWSDEELYTTGMFHGQSFQGVKHLRGWNQESTEAELRVISTSNFFRSCPQVQFQVDAGLLDAAGQLVAYWISEQSEMDFHAFPFQVKTFRFFSTPLPPETTVTCRGKISFVHDRQLSAHLEILTLSGEIIAQIEGWQDVFFTVPHRFFECRMSPQTTYLSHPWMSSAGVIVRRVDPFPAGFLESSGGLLQRVLANLVLNAAEREFWYDLPVNSPRRLNWLMGRIVAKDCIRQWAEEQFQLKLAPVDITILPSATGKPQIVCPTLEAIAEIPDLSISHSQGWAVAAIAPLKQQIGLDVQPLKAVNSEDIISLAFSVAEWQSLPKLSSDQVVGLWSVKEAASKAIGVQLHQPHDWQITDYSPETGKVTLMYGDRKLDIQLIFTPEEAIAICQIPPKIVRV